MAGVIVARRSIAAVAVVAVVALTGCHSRSNNVKRKAAPSTLAALPSRVVVWTPVGVVTLADWSDPHGTSATDSFALRAPLSSTRQLWPGRVVGIAVDGIRPATRAGTLVSFDPANPTDAVELGPASAWFPSHDGRGVWRVHQVAGGFPGAASDVVYEVQSHGLDGRRGGPILKLAVSDIPVAAARDGVVVQRPAPRGRPYPANVGNGPRTDIGGTTYDLVVVDAAGHTTRRISDYTAVRRADVGGEASVVNSDPNVRVRPTEALDLDTGRHIADPAAELVYSAHPQPQTSVAPGGGAVAASYAGLQTLYVDHLGGRGEQVTAALPNDDTYDRRLAFNVQATLQRGPLLMFPEATARGVVLVAWDMSRGSALGRSAAVFPSGSFPIGLVA